MLRLLLRSLLRILLWLGVLSVLLVLFIRWINPSETTLMFERQVQAWLSGSSLTIHHDWQPWDGLPDDLKMAVLAPGDQKFLDHRGFDLAAIEAAFKHNAQGGTVRGASTISQQLAKNLFLWSERSWFRKGLEAWFTFLLEAFCSKQRILELYLNSVEWGDGIFGAQAAAQYYFGIPVQSLSETQASLLAAILPNPREWSASHPSDYVKQRALWIRQQMQQLGGRRYLAPLR